MFDDKIVIKRTLYQEGTWPESIDLTVSFFLLQIKNASDVLIAPLPTYSYCKQISAQEFEEQKVSTSQAAIAELLENIIKNKSLPLKEKRKKLKQVSEWVSSQS